jgi:hypothetical protein
VTAAGCRAVGVGVGLGRTFGSQRAIRVVLAPIVGDEATRVLGRALRGVFWLLCGHCATRILGGRPFGTEWPAPGLARPPSRHQRWPRHPSSLPLMTSPPRGAVPPAPSAPAPQAPAPARYASAEGWRYEVTAPRTKPATGSHTPSRP